MFDDLLLAAYDATMRASEEMLRQLRHSVSRVHVQIDASRESIEESRRVIRSHGAHAPEPPVRVVRRRTRR